MSEVHTINVSEWKELHAELEEVRDKRNRLQTENNRLKTLMQVTRKECDEAENELRKMTAERDAARKFADDTQAELSQWQVGHDFIKEQLAQAKEGADMVEKENAALQDTVRHLREQRKAILAKQIHDDLPGLLKAIQAAAQQARELI